MVFPEPVISIAIKPKDQGNAEKMGVAIGKMVAEDPTFIVETDEDSGETILKGMGELHLDIKVDILKRTYGVEALIGKPQVAYRESITKTLEDSYTHKKQSGGSGQFAKIQYTLEPLEPGEGFQFESKVVGGNVPREFWPAVEKASSCLRKKVSSRATLAWTSRSHSLMVPSTQWIPQRSRSRLQPRQPIVSHSPKRVLRSLSRS
jgi:elongation factor G